MPVRTLLIIGWGCVAVELLFVIGLLTSRNVGDDAAGRGLGTAFGAVLAPVVLLIGGTLLWGTLTHSRATIVAGSLLATLPFLVMLGMLARGTLRKGMRAIARRGQGAFQSSAITRIARAIDRGDPVKVMALVRGAELDCSARDKYGRTLLGHAVHKAMGMYARPADVAIVRGLLDNGVPYAADAVESGGDWAATIASNAGDHQNVLLETALSHGADANARDWADDQPALFSVNMTVAKAELLLAHGADVNKRAARADRRGWTALMSAAYEGQWEMARWFLAHGVDPEVTAPDGKSLRTLVDDFNARARSQGYQQHDEATSLLQAIGAG
ncbi:MAG: ankyrin repeat domain-containing protein [Gemmatimonadaceae bacterium]|nr:ankyrin repeat domain-containing protein [Gemmatimonadaceae bacterium]